MPLKDVYKGVKGFAKDAVLGGLTFLLPFGILIFTFTWLFNLLTGLFSPLIKLIVDNTSSKIFVAEIMAILILVVGCFYSHPGRRPDLQLA